MISRSTRVLHAVLVAALGAGVVYCPARAQTDFNRPPGHPSYYGRIAIGRLAAPPVFNRRPVTVRPADHRNRWSQASLTPVYLRVPRNQARDWRRYCGLYQACSLPVYFVQDDWYRNVYGPWMRAEAFREARDRWRSANHRPVPRPMGMDAVRPFGPEDRRERDRD